MKKSGKSCLAVALLLCAPPAFAADNIDCALKKLNGDEIRAFIDAATGDKEMPVPVDEAARQCMSDHGGSQQATMEAMTYSIMAAMRADALVKLDMSGISSNDLDIFFEAMSAPLFAALVSEEGMNDAQAEQLVEQMGIADWPVTEDIVIAIATVAATGARMKASQAAFSGL